MSNNGLYKNETFFKYSFKDLTLYVDLNKQDENVLFSLPLYSSEVSRLLSIGVIYNKLEENSNICNHLSHSLTAYICNKTTYGLDLRFFDGYFYHFSKPRDREVFECSELDGEISFNGTNATLILPGYKKLVFKQANAVYNLTMIEGYQDTVNLTYNTSNKLTQITSTAFNSGSINFTYNQNETIITIYRNGNAIYAYVIEHASNTLESISINSSSSCVDDYFFNFVSNGLTITDSFSNAFISINKINNTYTFLDELGLTTTILILDDYSLVSDPYNQVVKYTFDDGLIYKIEKDNKTKFFAFKNKKLIIEGSIYEDFSKIGGLLTDYSILQNGTTVSVESLLSTYPSIYYQNQLGITFNFDDEEVLVKRYQYKGRKNQPISAIIYYSLDDYDEYFGYVDFIVNFYRTSGEKLLSTSPTYSYKGDELYAWRVVVLSAVCNADYDYFDIEVKARGFYSRIYLYINAFTNNLANTYNYIGNKLSSSLIDGVSNIYSYDEEHFLINDGTKTISYNNKGLPVLESDFFNNVVSNTYDTHNRLISSISEGSGYKQVKSKSYPSINSIQEQDEYISKSQTTSDSRLLINESISSISSTQLETRSYSYDSRNNLVSQNINNYHLSSYSYNSNKDVISINEYTFNYSSTYLPISVYYHDLNLLNKQYDSLNRLSSKIYPNYIYSFSYDDKNRISSVLFNGQPFITYTYDPFYDLVVDINNDHYSYDEYQNLVSISNNEYTKNNIIDYRNNKSFQNISINNEDNLISEDYSSITPVYQELIKELTSISTYTCFFKKRKVSSLQSLLAFIENPLTGILSYVDDSLIQFKDEGSMVYGQFTNLSLYNFYDKLRLQNNYQITLLARKLSSSMSIEVLFNDFYSVGISFDSDKTYFFIGSNEIEINTSYLDDKFHMITFNIPRTGIISLLVDGTVVSTIDFDNLITSINGLNIPQGNELYGIIVNTNSDCFTNSELTYYKNRFNSICSRNNDNEFNYVKYPSIFISNNMGALNFEYYSFDRTYLSSKGYNVTLNELTNAYRDEDECFVFDKTISRFVHSNKDHSLTYNLSNSDRGTISFFFKPNERGTNFVQIGSLKIGTNVLSRLIIQQTTIKTTSKVLSINNYSFISVSYDFVSARRCNVVVYVDGVQIYSGSYSSINPFTEIIIRNTNAYIKDLCVHEQVLSTSEILSLYYKLKRNIRHVCFYNSLNLIQQEIIRNDEGEISNTIYNYQTVNNFKKPRIISKTTYLDDASIGETYAYDALNRITGLVNNSSNSFTYDSNNQLSSAIMNGHTYSYSYDNKGNILSKTKDNQVTNYTYHSDYQNRLSSFGNTTFIYNEDNPLFISQIIKGGVITNITYEGKNLKTYSNNNRQISFSYDYRNLRVSKVVSSNNETITYKYYYDLSDNLIKQTKIISSEVIEEITFLRDSNGLYGLVYNGNQYLYNKDILGIINNIVDINGNIVVNYEYSPYGELINVTGSLANTLGQINPYIYKGYYYDVETSLYYITSRYYDPEIGRFISPDSVDYLDPTTINGLNLYAYCGNDPVNRVDPTGHFAISSFLIGLGISALIGAVVGAFSYTASEGLSYAITGEFTWSWAQFAGSVIGGAIGGAISTIPGMGTMAVAGITGALSTGIGMHLQNQWEGTNYSVGQILFTSTINGLVSASAAGIFEAIPIKGLNRGRGSYEAIAKQINTKFFNGTIKHISYNTFSKVLTYNMISSLIGTGYSGIMDVCNGNDWLSNLFYQRIERYL